MPLATRMVQRSQKVLQQTQGQHKLLYAGETFAFTKSTESRGRTIEIDGDLAQVSMTILVSKGDWSGAPITADNDVITVDSTLITADMTGFTPPVLGSVGEVQDTQLRYRIADVRQDPYDALWIIDLVDPRLDETFVLPEGIGTMIIEEDFIVG